LNALEELERYQICVPGIQLKWFGMDIWPAANGCTFLHLGRPFPEGNTVVNVLGFFSWLLGYGDKLVRSGMQLIQAKLCWTSVNIIAVKENLLLLP